MDAARLPLHYRNRCSLFSQLSVRLLGSEIIAAIKGHASLLAELTEAGFTHKTTILTPKQILALVRQWGMPLLVKEAIDKNPYLFVPKMAEKI